MDPDACFAAILEHISDGAWGEAAENAENLRTWLNKGGFPPGGGKLREASIYALLNWLIKHPERDPEQL
jgi:hypothetical protein